MPVAAMVFLSLSVSVTMVGSIASPGALPLTIMVSSPSTMPSSTGVMLSLVVAVAVAAFAGMVTLTVAAV